MRFVSGVDEEGCEAELGHGYKGHGEEEEWVVLDVRLGRSGGFTHRYCLKVVNLAGGELGLWKVGEKR